MEKANLQRDITFKSTSQVNGSHGEIKQVDANGEISNTNPTMSHKLPTQFYTTINEFTVESGEMLTNVTIAFTVNGLLNSTRINAIVVCHALSGSAAVEDWWPSLATHANPALDPNNFCIICCNSLGSPYGSASPLSTQFRDGQAKGHYGPAFPKTTIRDDVR